jgi:hypothetical protein
VRCFVQLRGSRKNRFSPSANGAAIFQPGASPQVIDSQNLQGLKGRHKNIPLLLFTADCLSSSANRENSLSNLQRLWRQLAGFLLLISLRYCKLQEGSRALSTKT